MFKALNYFIQDEDGEKVQGNWWQWVVALFVVLIWVVSSGSGGIFPQSSDYVKHNAIIFDLSNFHWPSTYQDQAGNRYYLIYYLAYYLPPAFLAKLFGSEYLNFFMLGQTVIGVMLAICWFFKIIRSVNLWAVFLFIFFGGLDIVGVFFTDKKLFLNLYSHIEWWIGQQYSSQATQLWWVPQHAITSWLITGMLIFLYERSGKNGNFSTPFVWVASLSALWSPFVMLGLIPYCVLILFRHGVNWQARKILLSFENLLGAGLIFFVVGVFYQARLLQDVSGFIWQSANLKSELLNYLFFVLIEFLLFALLLFTKTEERRLLTVATATLLLLPFFHFGAANDFGMRASMPSLFVLVYLVARFFVNPKNDLKWAKITLVALLIIGAQTGGHEIARNISGMRWGRWHGNGYNYVSIADIGQGYYANQYIGNARTKLFEFIFRDGDYQKILPEDIVRAFK
ncbi:MAG: hypothetical protein A2504_12515 [Bdellovibrionales bacterium RIFOXYD12_FULL_39_22]|nr:MAG: hypothetical protein A2385_00145 [Bdellovibrionales bacterium RIFOXYB1_FULL_39_21]OFZ44066.1 MAG: hypothetical protein A2485_03810 [Bdellovibrionales bacterium RIFOXYC12_FULL_39_17]OFZ48532.1 MAG: hypothetical protein A2404_07260 [Bdellovibrionales bacterium RIFOXYC1_FULL_39_130]OFZ76720.1 MAG: hypothetical protein A2560_11635 [Bdellovibrionales bacterium RIFOXYD1_FULL_39_84]OFZ94998.1 MAG: hypothetical protein A2504_12515 [Bdellovibrionales bacterium RIFOXYD12_FULL_39_22]